MEIIKKNSIIPKLSSVFINVYAITIWPFVFIRDEGNDKTINHERIHLKQQAELLVLPFYVLYVLFWAINLVRYRNSQEAYYAIPFEQEAYHNDHDWAYLLNRKRFAWLKYINPK